MAEEQAAAGAGQRRGSRERPRQNSRANKQWHGRQREVARRASSRASSRAGSRQQQSTKSASPGWTCTLQQALRRHQSVAVQAQGKGAKGQGLRTARFDLGMDWIAAGSNNEQLASITPASEHTPRHAARHCSCLRLLTAALGQLSLLHVPLPLPPPPVYIHRIPCLYYTNPYPTIPATP
jgi:hypothetical protein